MNITQKNRVNVIKRRIRRLIDEYNLSASAIAMRSNVEKGTIRALYEQKEFAKRTIAESTAKKIDKGLDECERSLGLVKRCSRCGEELPIGRYYANQRMKDGLDSTCKSCSKKHAKRKDEAMNNNTENAITAETVRRVKAEDRRDLESKFMAPYFKITPKQLDEIRKGVWDKLLLTKKEPERAESVLSAVEELRKEVALLRREVETVMIEMGVEFKVA